MKCKFIKGVECSEMGVLEEKTVITEEHLWVHFTERVNEDENEVAVFQEKERFSRGEIYRRAKNLAEQFSDLGITKGSKVLFDSHSTVDTVIIGLAISKLEAIICPINYKLSEHDLSIIIEKLGADAYISRKRSSDGIILVGTENEYYLNKTLPKENLSNEMNQEIALIGFTSGTTGIPKAVPHKPSALNYASYHCYSIAGLKTGDPIMAISPLTSAAGWTFNVHMALSLGLPLVLREKWDPLKTLELMHYHKVKWAMCVPTHLLLMLEEVKKGNWNKKIDSVNALSVGGSPNSEDMVRDTKNLLGIDVLRMYGMSECLGHASMRLDSPIEKRLIFDGKPFDGTHVEAYDENEEILPRGQIGQAGVKGPSLFLGYLHGLGHEENKLTKDGAFLTGDLIYRDEEGYIKVVGRIKDQINRGGLKIDPSEVENALIKHPHIVEAAVIGKPDQVLGERICAVISKRTTKDLTLEEICKHLQRVGLSKNKWPEFLITLSELPKTDFGKVDKKQIKKMIEEEYSS